uniref:SprT-like domain-containing protein n=1 Tax=viral metagenome TaxID=1070528 RepID=A0A6M3KLG6_9ZZZZ
MIVKVPRSIKIGNFNFKVKFTEHLKVDDNWRGSCNQRKGLIEIDPIAGNSMNRTLIHEVVHMIDFNYECGFDEDTTSRIANGVSELIFDNLGVELDWSGIDELEEK